MDQELFNTIYNLSSFEIMIYCCNILGSYFTSFWPGNQIENIIYHSE